MDILDRFLHYVSFSTNSDEESDTCPSSQKQWALISDLEKELRELGLSNVKTDEHGYTYAFVPGKGTLKNAPCLGFIAHVDTSPAANDQNIRPRVIAYEGGDIELGVNADGHKVVTRLDTFPILKDFVGKHLVITDGTTLLGADDKAGVAEIVTLAERLLTDPAITDHRPVAIAFTPDEEIGRGADLFDVKGFPAETAYTIDGGLLGEIEYENFNAAGVTLKINGVNVHPGSAKNVMKSALIMAQEWMNLLPAAETPAHTEGYEGFYHLCSVNGDETLTVIKMIVRDHDRAKFEERKAFVEKTVAYMNAKWGENSFDLDMKDSYYNMKEKIEPDHLDLIENAKRAFTECGATPHIMAIRGGTDGARLSFEGLPCPNLSVGGFGFHGVHEAACVEDMQTMVEVMLKLCR